MFLDTRREEKQVLLMVKISNTKICLALNKGALSAINKQY
jgi:hypothetical protein